MLSLGPRIPHRLEIDSSDRSRNHPFPHRFGYDLTLAFLGNPSATTRVDQCPPIIEHLTTSVSDEAFERKASNSLVTRIDLLLSVTKRKLRGSYAITMKR
jgi:hypothetical protein